MRAADATARRHRHSHARAPHLPLHSLPCNARCSQPTSKQYTGRWAGAHAIPPATPEARPAMQQRPCVSVELQHAHAPSVWGKPLVGHVVSPPPSARAAPLRPSVAQPYLASSPLSHSSEHLRSETSSAVATRISRLFERGVAFGLAQGSGALNSTHTRAGGIGDTSPLPRDIQTTQRGHAPPPIDAPTASLPPLDLNARGFSWKDFPIMPLSPGALSKGASTPVPLLRMDSLGSLLDSHTSEGEAALTAMLLASPTLASPRLYDAMQGDSLDRGHAQLGLARDETDTRTLLHAASPQASEAPAVGRNKRRAVEASLASVEALDGRAARAPRLRECGGLGRGCQQQAAEARRGRTPAPPEDAPRTPCAANAPVSASAARAMRPAAGG